MKKKVCLFALISTLFICAFSFMACENNKTEKLPKKLNFELVYVLAQDAGYTGTLEEFTYAFKGDSAYQLAVSKGYRGTEADWLVSLIGANGVKGENGLTPHIGDNNNWFIGTVDTGVKAQGKSAFEIFITYNPDYIGDEEQWINDLVNGRLIKFTITFKSEGSPDIVKSVFYGYTLTEIPQVPIKAGNVGEWDRTNFDNITENIIVTAIYKTIGMTFELINENKEYKLISANLSSDVKILEIPSEYQGKQVTTIGYRAVLNQTSLTHVTVPNSVKLIESEAFSGCDNIEKITLPFIGESLDAEVNCYLGYIFGNTSSANLSAIPTMLKSVKVTGGNAIGDHAFAGCGGLTSIELPNSVTAIGSRAFDNCGGLTSIIIPNSVTAIGSYAFSNCVGLTSIEMPNSVKTIGSYAFDNCCSLTSIEIPNGATAIGSYAFSNCVGLISITIPDSVVYIGDSAFAGCSKLEYEIHGSLKYINNVLIGITTTSNSSITLKPTTTIIYYRALNNCKKLTDIVIPDSVKSIGSYAFNNCSGLTSIIIPDSVKTINSYAFDGCGSLISIVLGKGVEEIFDGAFKSCESLTAIYYGGKDSADYSKIAITNENLALFKATRYYYSETENYDGAHWRYIKGVATVWKSE